jgi:chromosome segregation ATPase
VCGYPVGQGTDVMGFPSYLESINERLISSLDEFTNKRSSGGLSTKLSLQEIKKAVGDVLDQAIPPEFLRHLSGPTAEEEYYYKTKFDETQNQLRSTEARLEQQECRYIELTAVIQRQENKIESLEAESKEFTGRATSLLNENRSLRTRCKELEDELKKSESHFTSRLSEQKVAFENSLKLVEIQRVQDMRDWKKFTEN